VAGSFAQIARVLTGAGLLGLAGASLGHAQDPGAILNDVFGGILRNAISDAAQNAARKEWRHVSQADIACLQNHGFSVRELINSGVVPNDPRVREQLAGCHRSGSVGPPIREPVATQSPPLAQSNDSLPNVTQSP
jgi:hypothetical protein